MVASSVTVDNLMRQLLLRFDFALALCELTGSCAARDLRAGSRELKITLDEVLPFLEEAASKDLLLCCGAGQASEKVFRYNLSTDAWADLPVATKGPSSQLVGAAVMGFHGRLLIAGGSSMGFSEQLEQPLAEVWTLQPASGVWKRLANMSRCRFRASGVPLGSRPIVCGGAVWGGDLVHERVMSTVETLENGEWRMLPCMHHAREGATVGVIGRGPSSALLVCGGSNGKIDLSSVECLENGHWRSLPAMTFPRHRAIGATLHGVFYVCGGCGENSPSDVERFDPAVGVWEVLPAMREARRGGVGAAVNGKLLVFGGESFLQSAVAGFLPVILLSGESFDPETFEWQPVAPIPVGRRLCSAAAIAQ